MQILEQEIKTVKDVSLSMTMKQTFKGRNEPLHNEIDKRQTWITEQIKELLTSSSSYRQNFTPKYDKEKLLNDSFNNLLNFAKLNHKEIGDFKISETNSIILDLIVQYCFRNDKPVLTNFAEKEEIVFSYLKEWVIKDLYTLQSYVYSLIEAKKNLSYGYLCK